MQTFLPYESFQQSASALDMQRLGKQRVETLQILRTLFGESAGWKNHPAVTMWCGHEAQLLNYGVTVCLEWMRRGYNDTVLDTLIGMAVAYGPLDTPRPPWLGDPDFHRSHQSNLLRKNAAHYGPLWPGVPDDLPYVWPVSA